MKKEEKTLFTVETLYDPAVHHEFQTGVRNASIPKRICGCIAIAGFFFGMFFFRLDDRVAYAYLIAAVPLLLLRLLSSLNAGKGNLGYQRILRSNGGKMVHQIVTFGQGDICTRNRDTLSEKRFSYSQILSIIETKNLLILTMKPKLGLVLEKRWMQGGTVEELKNYLQSRCPNIRRKVRSDKAGRIIGILLTAVMILGSVFAVQRITVSSDLPLGQVHGDMSCTEILEALEPLGITCEDESILAELDDYEYTSGSEKTLSLLCWLGYGEYDYDTWEWTPSQNGVYWFDAEFAAVDCMYTDFLRGVSALGKGELDFTNVREDHTDVDWDQGTGTVRISFDWNGQTYETNAQMMSDWFDGSVMDALCRIVGGNSDKNLYYTFDGGQGYLMFYGDEDWASAFTSLTGIPLETN